MTEEEEEEHATVPAEQVESAETGEDQTKAEPVEEVQTENPTEDVVKEDEQPEDQKPDMEEMVRSDCTEISLLHESRLQCYKKFLQTEDKDGASNDDDKIEIENDTVGADGEVETPAEAIEAEAIEAEDQEELTKEPKSNLEGMFEVMSSCHY